MDKRIEGRLYRRLVHKYFLNDLMFDLRLEAKREAVAFIKAHMATAMLFDDRYALLSYALDRAPAKGLLCEFGVAGGKTIRHIAKQRPDAIVHGFDSFQGLPADWTGTAQRRGSFSQAGKAPKVPENVRLHEGLFDCSLPRFLALNPGPAAFLHLDADTYASTKCVLDLIGPRLMPGAVLVFDEYLNYPAWREHEHKALCEFLAATGRIASYIGFSTMRGQAAVLIES